MYVCVCVYPHECMWNAGVHVLWHPCKGKKTTFGSLFSSPILFLRQGKKKKNRCQPELLTTVLLYLIIRSLWIKAGHPQQQKHWKAYTLN